MGIKLQKALEAYKRGDYSIAKKMLVKLVVEEPENEIAFFILGEMSNLGRGTVQDFQEAASFYTVSARLGNPAAQQRLGAFHILGLGVNQDDREGAKWYKLSAKQGNVSSRFLLGKLYISGRGVKKNIHAAKEWLSLAADQGHAQARHVLENIERLGPWNNQSGQDLDSYLNVQATLEESASNLDDSKTGENQKPEFLEDLIRERDAEFQELTLETDPIVRKEIEGNISYLVGRIEALKTPLKAEGVRVEENILEEIENGVKNKQNFSMEEMNSEELKRSIVRTLENYPNNSCVYSSLDTKVLGHLGIVLRGKNRKDFTRRIKVAAGQLQRAGILEKYKNYGGNSNQRIRLTKNFYCKFLKLTKTWETKDKENETEGETDDSQPNLFGGLKHDEMAEEELGEKFIEVPNFTAPNDSYEIFTPFADDDCAETYDSDDETIEKLNVLTGGTKESNENENEEFFDSPPHPQKRTLPSDIFRQLIKSLSGLPGVTAHQEINNVIILFSAENKNLKIDLEIKGGYLTAESFLPLDKSLMEKFLEISGGAGFSCRLGIEANKYVIRRGLKTEGISANDIYECVLEIISDVKRINGVTREE